MNVVFILIGASGILLGAFTDAGYEWFTTRWQRRTLTRKGLKAQTIAVGVLMLILGIIATFDPQ